MNMNQLDMINDILLNAKMNREFKDLNAIDCLLKIMKDNKKNEDKKGTHNEPSSD